MKVPSAIRLVRNPRAPLSISVALISSVFLCIVATNIGAAQSAKNVFAAVVPRLKATTKVPIYLPIALPTDNGTLFADILELTRTSYLVEFTGYPNCNGTSACEFGFVSGSTRRDKDAPPQTGSKTHLADLTPAYFSKSTCGGAGCSGASLVFSRKGYRYSVGMKAGKLTDLLPLANAMRRF